jgi:hypothetical protein
MILTNLVQQLESYMTGAHVKVSSVSKRGVDWHIDHALKVINVSAQAVIDSDPKDYKSKFNFYRSLLLPLGYFPRKKVKAPKVVNNREEIEIEDLVTQLEQAKALISELNTLEPKKNFKHPYFGVLNLKESQRFLAVHTNHHLKIIKDILSKHK